MLLLAMQSGEFKFRVKAFECLSLGVITASLVPRPLPRHFLSGWEGPGYEAKLLPT